MKQASQEKEEEKEEEEEKEVEEEKEEAPTQMLPLSSIISFSALDICSRFDDSLCKNKEKSIF